MRAGVILFNPQTKKILLIHRWKNGEEYFVIPGGGAEKFRKSWVGAYLKSSCSQPLLSEIANA